MRTMAWIKPPRVKARVDAAGSILIDPEATALDRVAALEMVNNWRAAHAYPLLNFRVTLSNRAKKIDPKAIVYQRLKRLPSIKYKLSHPSNMNMRLTQMQDIGGCRAVMSTVRGVNKLVRYYQASEKKNPRRTGVLLWPKDYVATPKSSGYRGIHLIYKYHSTSPECEAFNGLRIEIQIRSLEQHYWATAVEIAGTFTNQALKSSAGSTDWLRFFVLMGNVIAIREKSHLVPGAPTGKALLDELRQLATSLKVKRTLEGWTVIQATLAPKTSALRRSLSGADYYLLTLDNESKTVDFAAFRKKDLQRAFEQYIIAETQTAGKPDMQTVLVAVESFDALPRAYPNYFLDTTAFVKILDEAIG
jgi:hypothetical protein